MTAVVNLWRVTPRLIGALGGLAMLAGCGHSQAANPVTWWHDLQGGRIAQDRPPPPGVTDPYPNLSQVPAHAPKILSSQARAQETAQLVNQRDEADSLLARDWLPGTAGLKSRPAVPAPADQNASIASFQAANAAPRAGRAAVKPAPTVEPPVTEAAVPGAGEDAVGASPATGPMPSVPAAPPSPPNLPGIGGAGDARPAPVRPLPAPLPGMPIAFPPGSAMLPVSSVPAIQAAAARRHGRAVLVTGYGDATSGEPLAQAAALPLALQRAEAVAAILRQAGVPASAIHLTGEASGRGARLRLLD